MTSNWDASIRRRSSKTSWPDPPSPRADATWWANTSSKKQKTSREAGWLSGGIAASMAFWKVNSQPRTQVDISMPVKALRSHWHKTSRIAFFSVWASLRVLNPDSAPGEKWRLEIQCCNLCEDRYCDIDAGLLGYGRSLCRQLWRRTTVDGDERGLLEAAKYCRSLRVVRELQVCFLEEAISRKRGLACFTTLWVEPFTENSVLVNLTAE